MSGSRTITHSYPYSSVFRSTVDPDDSAIASTRLWTSSLTRAKSPDESGLNVIAAPPDGRRPRSTSSVTHAVVSANSASLFGSESFLRPNRTSRRPIGARLPADELDPRGAEELAALDREPAHARRPRRRHVDAAVPRGEAADPRPQRDAPVERDRQHVGRLRQQRQLQPAAGAVVDEQVRRLDHVAVREDASRHRRETGRGVEPPELRHAYVERRAE